jgi:hypothetical protein
MPRLSTINGPECVAKVCFVGDLLESKNNYHWNMCNPQLARRIVRRPSQETPRACMSVNVGHSVAMCLEALPGKISYQQTLHDWIACCCRVDRLDRAPNLS